VIQRFAVIGAVVVAVVAPGLTACASRSAQPAGLNVPVSHLAGTWRGNGRVHDTNGPIELKIAPDGPFTGTAGGAVVSGNLKTADGAITFDSIAPRQGATGSLTYTESGGKAMLKGAGAGKYSGARAHRLSAHETIVAAASTPSRQQRS
jgi:hypothetical protein